MHLPRAFTDASELSAIPTAWQLLHDLACSTPAGLFPLEDLSAYLPGKEFPGLLRRRILTEEGH